MCLLIQLLFGIGAFTLLVIVGSFIGIMMVVMFDVIVERRKARERNKWRK